ncbi:MAG: hypothetical protein CMH96_06165, partial [Oceanospirillaceae bacterium]|nr:hypothetical protein [Oceanospirillaceae bacterium]
MIADYQFGSDKLYKTENLTRVIEEVLKRLNFSHGWLRENPISVSIERDRFDIQAYRTKMKACSLLTEFPNIAEEWHPNKNKNLSPDMFKPRS